MFCKECGRNIGEHYICPYCRTAQRSRPADEFINFSEKELPVFSRHSAAIAGFLQIFLGAFGAGRFYLGYTKVGVLQIIATVVTLGIGGFIWGVYDGIMILNGREKYDSEGKLLL